MRVMWIAAAAACVLAIGCSKEKSDKGSSAQPATGAQALNDQAQNVAGQAQAVANHALSAAGQARSAAGQAQAAVGAGAAAGATGAAAGATGSAPADFPLVLPDGTTGAFTDSQSGGTRVQSATFTWKGTPEQASAYFERVLRDKGLEPTVKKMTAGTMGTVLLRAKNTLGVTAKVLISSRPGTVSVSILWRDKSK